MDRSCQVEQINFRTSLEKLLENSKTFGSINKKSLPAPCGYSQVCFADTSHIGSSSFNCGNRIIQTSIRDNQQMNIFLVSKKTTYPIGYSQHISLNPANSCTCFNSTNGRFQFTLQGLGPTTWIKTAAQAGSDII